MPFRREEKRNSLKRHTPKDRNKNENYILHEKISEAEVGISEYVSHTEGFSGIIKARFSDFHVNEIDLQGNVAKLTDVEAPELPDSNSADNQNPEDVLKQFLPDICDKIENLLSNASEPLEIDITSLTKDDRASIHKCIKSKYGSALIAQTITKDDKKFMKLEKYDTKNKPPNRHCWPSGVGEYVHFIIYKENFDTMEACLRISNTLHIRPSNLNYAGVKDRRAKTTQWFSVKKIAPQRISSRTKSLRNIHVGNFTFKDAPLKLGQLRGNRFRIALRNVTADDEVIARAIESLSENGFINYYGLQRFGSDKEVPTFAVGINLLQGEWKEACQLILKPRKSDYPLSDITKAKNVFAQTSDPAAALREFAQHRNNCIEFRLLQGLSKNNQNDYVNALENIPRNSRLLYIHSFQSLIWNKVASKRIKEFGLHPIEGDLVVLSDDFVENEFEDNEGMEDNDSEQMEEKNNSDVGDNINSRVKVKTLKTEELSNYSIFDIVLPLPGFDIHYPENSMRQYYEELLKGYNLTLEMQKQKVKTYNLSGTYRKILKRAQNVSWKTLRYENPNDNLIRSDYEELRGENGPEDKPDGKYKALVLDFCLDSCCYATMALREVLKMDTNTVSHAKMNNYYKDTNKQEEAQEIGSFEKENDLLANKEKFEEFKKFVFGESEADEDACPAKKPKTDTT